MGNTSTDVEKTTDRGSRTGVVWKHLHGRGEDVFTFLCTCSEKETPPRTWRRHPWMLAPVELDGNTSTDVEKTRWPLSFTVNGGKHLHGRGEDIAAMHARRTTSETPPRTWRRPPPRNTSTDVEKTDVKAGTFATPFETPPRTWRRQPAQVEEAIEARNTSTDVEKTLYRRRFVRNDLETPPRTWRRQQDLALC